MEKLLIKFSILNFASTVLALHFHFIVCNPIMVQFLFFSHSNLSCKLSKLFCFSGLLKKGP